MSGEAVIDKHVFHVFTIVRYICMYFFPSEHNLCLTETGFNGGSGKPKSKLNKDRAWRCDIVRIKSDRPAGCIWSIFMVPRMFGKMIYNTY